MAGKPSGHSRLKSALILRDALLQELGLPLGAMKQLTEAETEFGAARALAEDRYLHALISVCRKDSLVLEQLDGTVRTACAKVQLAPRYAQYLALILFTHWMHMRQMDTEAFLARLNVRLEKHGAKGETVTPFTENDLQFAAFWMATASGKTHVLHACLALLTEDRVNGWDRIFIITPSEALTRQHVEKLRGLNLWHVFAYPMDGDDMALRNLPRETVIVLDINKLTEKKTDEGIRIPTSAFKDDRNLVFVDEGHKGQKSEQSLWKQLQQDLAGIDSENGKRLGMLIEFSATFGQVAEGEHAFDRYAKSVILDYAYDRFHGDLYGKDFWHVKMEGRGDAAPAVQEQTLTSALLAFWCQLVAYRSFEDETENKDRRVAVALPLWVLLGLSVIGGKRKMDREQTSDVIAVLKFLEGILTKPDALVSLIKGVLDTNVTGAHILPDEVRNPIRERTPEDLSHQVLSNVFGFQPGDKPVFRLLKSAEGEMGLGLLRGDAVHYYGVVNVGDAWGLKKAMGETGLKVEDDAFTPSLFESLGDPVSPVHVLIGSRRFAEGWDNYRASSLTLLRLGQGEGSLIIQMFGRVVRFAGRNGDGKRLGTPDKTLRPLQTAYIYGLRSSYLEAFLNGLYENGVPLTIQKSCDVKMGLPEGMPLHSVGTVMPEKRDFHVHLSGSTWVSRINKVRMSLTATVYTSAMSRHGVISERGVMGRDLTQGFKINIPLLDTDGIYLRMVDIKRQKGWWNFSFDPDAVKTALSSSQYELWGLPASLRIQDDSDLMRLNRTASALVRRIFESAYRGEENKFTGYELIPARKSGIPERYRKEKIHVQV